MKMIVINDETEVPSDDTWRQSTLLNDTFV